MKIKIYKMGGKEYLLNSGCLSLVSDFDSWWIMCWAI